MLATGFSSYTKFAIICNLCFLATFINHHYPFLKDSSATATIIILGQLLALAATLIYFIWHFLFQLKYKLTGEHKLLLAVNILFFILHLYYYFLF